MISDPLMRERVEMLCAGAQRVIEARAGGRVNIDKWLEETGPAARGFSGRERTYVEYAVLLAAVDQIVASLAGASVSIDGAAVVVSRGDGSALVVVVSFTRYTLIERRDGHDQVLGTFTHEMCATAVVWRLATGRWGQSFERELEWPEPYRVLRGKSGLGYYVSVTATGSGPNALVWDAEDAISFARGCAYEVSELVAVASALVARGVAGDAGAPVDVAERIAGCLLGGAVGDALGYPVEFEKRAAILGRVGAAGVHDFLAVPGMPVGAVSDDTQMTLFTADALLRRADGQADGRADGQAVRALMVDAYRDWYVTQTVAGPESVSPRAPRQHSALLGEEWLFARRAPGLTVMGSLEAIAAGPAAALVGPADNQSKGCGTVMRSAPFGVVLEWSAEDAFRYAAEASAITHGHPTAHVSAGALAMLVRLLVGGAALPGAVRAVVVHVEAQEPTGRAETSTMLRQALNPVQGWSFTAESVDNFDVAGWVAEEALGIAVYCALRFPGRDQIEEAFSFAVTHSGDSDSTGAICGNILGAVHGVEAIPERWRAGVEGRGTIAALAEALARSCAGIDTEPESV